MTIAAFSTAGFSQYIAASSNISASQQAFNSLQQNLASGNLTAAQAAFKTYQQLNQSSAASTANSSSGSSSSATSSQYSKDITALGAAISSGDLANAQSAFTTLQSDLKTSPSQAVTNAEAAAAQTVSWVDDLLNLSTSNATANTADEDPTTTILDSAYGQNTANNASDPTTSILDSAYGSGSTGTSSTAPAASAASASGGNRGSGATVNAYA